MCELSIVDIDGDPSNSIKFSFFLFGNKLYLHLRIEKDKKDSKNGGNLGKCPWGK
jgi:hypothetical protein